MATIPTTPPAIGWAEGTHEKTRGVYRTENVRLKNACKAAAKLLGAYSWFDGDGNVYHTAEPLPTGVQGLDGDLPSYWRSLRDLLEAAGVLTVEGRYQPLPLVGDAVFLVVQYQDYTRVGAASANSYTYGVWKTVARFEVLQNVNSYGFADGKALDVYYDQGRKTTVRILRDVVPVVDRESYLSGGYSLATAQTVIGSIAPFSVPVIDDGWAVIGDLEDNPTPDFGVRESLLVIPTGYPGSKGEQGDDGAPGQVGATGKGIAYTEFTINRELIIHYTDGMYVNLGQVFGADVVQPPPPPPPPPPPLLQTINSEWPVQGDEYAIVVPVVDVAGREYWIPAPVRFVVDSSLPVGVLDQVVRQFYLSNEGSMTYEIYNLWSSLPGSNWDDFPYRSVLVRLSDGVVLAKMYQYEVREEGDVPYFTESAYADDLLLLGANADGDWTGMPGYLLWRGSLAGDYVSVDLGVIGGARAVSGVIASLPDAELSAGMGADFFPLPQP